MDGFWGELKELWADMLEPPWRGAPDDRGEHWFFWLIGWTWVLAGLILGALYAPLILQFAGLSDTTFEDWLVIAVAVLAGFLVQLLGWGLVGLLFGLFGVLPDDPPLWLMAPVSLIFALLLVGVLVLPLVGAGYGINLYFTSVGADQRTVTIAFVGGLLVKTFLLPFIKSLVTGAAFKVLMDWLRGGKKKGT